MRCSSSHASGIVQTRLGGFFFGNNKNTSVSIPPIWRGNGAAEKTRTSTGCPTATSTLRVYQFRHGRTGRKAGRSRLGACSKTKIMKQVASGRNRQIADRMSADESGGIGPIPAMSGTSDCQYRMAAHATGHHHPIKIPSAGWFSSR